MNLIEIIITYRDCVKIDGRAPANEWLVSIGLESDIELMNKIEACVDDAGNLITQEGEPFAIA